MDTAIPASCQRYQYHSNQERTRMPDQQISEHVIQFGNERIGHASQYQSQRGDRYANVDQNGRRPEHDRFHLIASFGQQFPVGVHFDTVMVEHCHELTIGNHQQRSVLDDEHLVALIFAVLERHIVRVAGVDRFVVKVNQVVFVLDTLRITVEYGVDGFDVQLAIARSAAQSTSSHILEYLPLRAALVDVRVFVVNRLVWRFLRERRNSSLVF